MAGARYLALALLACLALGAAAQLAPLSKPGGPPVLEGLLDVLRMDSDTQFPQTLAVGWTLNSQYTHNFFNSSEGRVYQETGTYTSWECGAAPGTYRAIVDVTTTNPDGTTSTKTVCQYGEVYLLQLQTSWVQSELACPFALPTDQTEFVSTLHSLPQDPTFECGEAMDDSEGMLTGTDDDAMAPAGADEDFLPMGPTEFGTTTDLAI